MYKISVFSKITNLTVKALRYYDDENILKPSFRDDNGYRYYNDSDYQKALLVQHLRMLDFSIAEIKDVLSTCEQEEDISYYLLEKKEAVLKNMDYQKALIEKINSYITPIERKNDMEKYKIEKKEIPETLVASIRFQGKYSDVGKYIGTIYKEIKGKSIGEPFSCYYQEDYQEQADIELCVPIKTPISTSTVTIKTLPKVHAITTIHIGPYEELSKAYKVLLDYAEEHHLKCLLPSREIYKKGPGMIFKGNQNQYITEIILPVEEG